ncbi:histidine phosphatase family protein, partial [bacterium M00.F.Ca.ET.163.01.1.1]
MTKIRFIRHGETDWNIAGKLQGRTDIPLNESGIKQAQACGISLLQNEWDL